jgi:predicted nucleic acid-binding protein
VSAFVRRAREDDLTAAGERQARDVLEALAAAWTEVLPSEPLRASTERLLAVHPLRAADAFQLAAALAWCQGHPTGRALVTFDVRLGAAGRREGFAILPSEG